MLKLLGIYIGENNFNPYLIPIYNKKIFEMKLKPIINVKTRTIKYFGGKH